MVRGTACLAAAILAIVAPFAPAVAQEPTASVQATDQDFTVFAIVTPAEQWRAQRDNPTAEPPSLTSMPYIAPGEVGVLVVFFSGALVRDDNAEIVCDVAISVDDGPPEAYPDQPCFSGRLPGGTAGIHPTDLELEIAPPPGEPRQRLTFDITVTDRAAGVSVPVSLSVEAGA